MSSSKMRVEFLFDTEAGNWNFMVPALRITGGGCDSREEAERHATEAIRFALADESGADHSPDIEPAEACIYITWPKPHPDRKTATG